jgi:hypothetical protein
MSGDGSGLLMASRTSFPHERGWFAMLGELSILYVRPPPMSGDGSAAYAMRAERGERPSPMSGDGSSRPKQSVLPP